MAYAIGYVVLGIDLSNDSFSKTEDPWAAHRDALWDLFNDGVDGFDGSGESSWFGITLGEFDECKNLTGEEMIALCTPSMDQILEYDALVGRTNANQNLSVKLRAVLASTKARVHILWGSS